MAEELEVIFGEDEEPAHMSLPDLPTAYDLRPDLAELGIVEIRVERQKIQHVVCIHAATAARERAVSANSHVWRKSIAIETAIRIFANLDVVTLPKGLSKKA